MRRILAPRTVLVIAFLALPLVACGSGPAPADGAGALPAPAVNAPPGPATAATTAEQAEIARAYIAQLDQAHVFGKPIVTTIEPGRAFYAAEGYHQDYLTRNPTNPYILINDMPKLGGLQRRFPDLYRADPVLVAGRQSSP